MTEGLSHNACTPRWRTDRERSEEKPPVCCFLHHDDPLQIPVPSSLVECNYPYLCHSLTCWVASCEMQPLLGMHGVLHLAWRNSWCHQCFRPHVACQREDPLQARLFQSNKKQHREKKLWNAKTARNWRQDIIIKGSGFFFFSMLTMRAEMRSFHFLSVDYLPWNKSDQWV